MKVTKGREVDVNDAAYEQKRGRVSVQPTLKTAGALGLG